MPEGALLSAVVGGVAGLLTGVIGSLVAPWVQWRIEQRRIRHEQRRRTLERWRTDIEGWANLATFEESDRYREMKPFLSDDTIHEIETGKGSLLRHKRVKKMILDDLTRLAERWKLL